MTARRLALLVLAVASPLGAQQIIQLPRITSTTGLNDSSLTTCADSVRPTPNTRACSLAQTRKGLSAKAFDSLIVTGPVHAIADSATGAARAQILTTARTLWGVAFNGSSNVAGTPTFGAGATVSNGQTFALGTSTISGTPTWSSAQLFASGQRVDSATGAARAQKLTTARTINGVAFDGTANISIAGIVDTTFFPLTIGTHLTGGSFNGSTPVTIATDATSANTSSRLVARDGSGNFAATAITANLQGTWSGTGRDSLLAGSALVFAANDTIYGQPVWNATQAFATGQSTDSATGAARAQLLTTSRTLWGLSFNGSANVTGKPAFASAWSSTGRDSLLAGSALAFAANDTVYGQPTWNATQTFATAQRVDSATGSARSQTLTTGRTLSISGDVTWTSPSFDGSGNVTAAGTLATVNSNVGTFGSSTSIPTFTVNGKGLITAASGNAVVAPAGTLTGATLAAGVTASSLTSVGTLASLNLGGALTYGSVTLSNAVTGTGNMVLSGGPTLTGTLTGNGAITGFTSANFSTTVTSGTGLTVTDGASTMTRTSDGAVLTLVPTFATFSGIAFNINASRAATSGYVFANFAANGVSQFSVNGAGAVGTTGTVTVTNASQAILQTTYTGTGALRATLSTFNDTGAWYDETNARYIWQYTASTNTVSRPTGTTAVQALTTTSAVITSGASTNSLTLNPQATGRPFLANSPNSAGAFGAYFQAGGSSWTNPSGEGLVTIDVNGATTQVGLKVVSGATTWFSVANGGVGTFAAGISATTVLASGQISATNTTTSLLASGDLSIPSGKKIHLDGSTGTYIIGATNTQTFYAGGSNAVEINDTNGLTLLSGNAILPGADAILDLGSASKRWSELYLSPAASGVGDTYICLSTAGQVHSGATCAASTRKIKQNIRPITDGLSKVLALQPSSFTYQKGFYGGKNDRGFIVEDAARVDPTYAQYAARDESLLNGQTIKKGDPEAINFMAILADLVATAQSQQKQIDSLKLIAKKAKP